MKKPRLKIKWKNLIEILLLPITLYISFYLMLNQYSFKLAGYCNLILIGINGLMICNIIEEYEKIC